jgi:hypothetical protein
MDGYMKDIDKDLLASQPIARKQGRPFKGNTEATFEALKPWVALGVSRMTWYRKRKKLGLSGGKPLSD